jgi:hypothetical protein
MPDNSEAFLRAILATTARQTFPPDQLAEMVGPPKQVQAFNLCDGTRSQTDIAKALKLDSGNFSRTVSRWVKAGIVFRLGEKSEAKLLHVYPLNGDAAKKKRTAK